MHCFVLGNTRSKGYETGKGLKWLSLQKLLLDYLRISSFARDANLLSKLLILLSFKVKLVAGNAEVVHYDLPEKNEF